MAIKYYTDINLNFNQLQNAVIHKYSVLPTVNLEAGRIIYLDTATATEDIGLYICNGTKWLPVAFGTTFYPAYPATAGTRFNVGDTLLRAAGTTPAEDVGLWICKTKYVGTDSWTTDKANWEFLNDITYAGDYTTGASYAPGQIVRYNGHLYVANTSVTGAPAALEPDKWNFTGANYSGNYDATKLYSVGELVEYNGNKYICTTVITAAEAFTPAHWERIETSLWRGAYDATATYFKNEMVRYNGVVYVAKQDIATAEAWTADHWDQLLSNDYRGAWAASTVYAKGEKVQQNGTLYVCITDHTSDATFSAAEAANWTAIARGTSWPTYDDANAYVKGDVVIKDGVVYIATDNKAAAATFDGTKWNSLYQIFKGEYDTTKTYQKGDEVYVTEGTPAKTTYYVCIADNTTGTFTAANWQKLGGDEQYKGEAIDYTTGKAKGKLSVGDIFKYVDPATPSTGTYFFEVISEIVQDEAFALTDISKVSAISPKVIKQAVTLVDGTLTGTVTLPLGAQLVEVKTVDTTSKARVVVEETYTEETGSTHATVVFTANIATGSTESITCTVSYI